MTEVTVVVTVTVMVPAGDGGRVCGRASHRGARTNQYRYLFVPYLAGTLVSKLLSYPHIICPASLRINIMVKSTTHPVCDIASHPKTPKTCQMSWSPPCSLTPVTR
jgi:hypothetical protein